MYRSLMNNSRVVKRIVLSQLIMTMVISVLFSAGLNQSVQADDSDFDENEYVIREIKTEEEAARLIWSACKYYRMPEQNIAAILGCLSQISSLDPGAIELVPGSFEEEDPLRISAMSDLKRYTEEHVLSYYQVVENVRSCLKDEYQAYNGSYYAGIGIAQWKGNQALDFLKEAVFLAGGQWNSLEYNAAYLLQSKVVSGKMEFGEMLCQWKTDDLSTEEAVTQFAVDWLGYEEMTDLTLQIEEALLYKDAMNRWEYDEEFAKIIKVLVDRLDHHRIIETFNYDNSSPELAGVSLSHRQQGDGFYNNGTELYRTVRDNVGDPDVIYQSCDRLIGAIFRWTGADIDFPMGNVRNQYRYVTTSDQWELIAVAEEITRENLEPGDIFICLGNVGHIWMYVGQEAIRAIYGEDFWPSDADSISAGYQRWSPMIGNYFYMHIEQDYGYVRDIDSATGTYYNPPQFVPYYQFRMVYSDESDLYKDAADGDPLRWPR